MRLYTIGHSHHSIEKLVNLLNDNSIMILVDVRTSPYSRYNPHFNKENLELILPGYNLQYVYAVKYLGGRPLDPDCYKSCTLPSEEIDYLHEVDYTEVMKRPWFIQAIHQLLEIFGWEEFRGFFTYAWLSLTQYTLDYSARRFSMYTRFLKPGLGFVKRIYD